MSPTQNRAPGRSRGAAATRPPLTPGHAREVAADAEDNPDAMQQQMATFDGIIIPDGAATEPRVTHTRQRSDRTAVSDRPVAKRRRSTVETMWGAQGIGMIGFICLDGWGGGPDTEAKYANPTPFAHHSVAVGMEKAADVRRAHVDGYDSDSETDLGSEDGQDY